MYAKLLECYCQYAWSAVMLLLLYGMELNAVFYESMGRKAREVRQKREREQPESDDGLGDQDGV